MFGPLGAATFRPEEDRDVLIIAGGSGIAGMMSILDRAVREGYFRAHRGHVFFGVRALADAFYLEELAGYVAAAGGRLKVTLALSHEPVAGEVHPQVPASASPAAWWARRRPGPWPGGTAIRSRSSPALR